MTIVDSVLDWLKTCPELENGMLNLDFLPDNLREYSVDVVPCSEVVQRYTSGAEKKQFIFYLASRAFVSDDIRDAQDNYTFYDAFSRWVKQQNLTGNLPDLGAGRLARSVEINTSGYPMYIDDDGKARYQIQLKLIYMEEA